MQQHGGIPIPVRKLASSILCVLALATLWGIPMLLVVITVAMDGAAVFVVVREWAHGTELTPDFVGTLIGLGWLSLGLIGCGVIVWRLYHSSFRSWVLPCSGFSRGVFRRSSRQRSRRPTDSG